MSVSFSVEAFHGKDSTLSQQVEIQLKTGNTTTEAQQKQFLTELTKSKFIANEQYFFFQNKWFTDVSSLFSYKPFISILLQFTSNSKPILLQIFPKSISYRFYLYNNTRLQVKVDEMKTVRELCYQIALEHTGLEMEFIDDFSILIAYKTNKKMWLNPNLSLREQNVNLSNNVDNFKLVFARKYYFFEKQILEKQKECLAKQSVSAFHLTFIQDRKRFLNHEIIEVSFQNQTTTADQIPESTVELSYLLYHLELLQNTNAQENWETIVPKNYLSSIPLFKEKFAKRTKLTTTNPRELEFQFVTKLSQQLMYSFELFQTQYNSKEVFLGISTTSITLFDFHTKRPIQLLKPNDVLHFFSLENRQQFILVLQTQQQFVFQYESPNYLVNRFEDYLKFWKLWSSLFTVSQQNNTTNNDLRIYMREAYEQLYQMERATVPIHLYCSNPTTTVQSNWTEEALLQKSKLQMELQALELQRDALKLKLEASKVGQQKMQDHFVNQFEGEQTQSKFELLKQYHNFLTWEKEKLLKKSNLVKEQEENLIKQKMELAFHQQQLLLNSNASPTTSARR